VGSWLFRFVSQTARLFGPAIFEASKLKVLFLGVDDEAGSKQHGPLPRTYTLTHSDVTARLTLAVSHTINRAQLQGWYNRLQRDEVVAEWKKVRGRMSLHVHCHISGGHFLLDLIAGLRYVIFRKELPVVRVYPAAHMLWKLERNTCNMFTARHGRLQFHRLFSLAN
jgi:magnesium dechelatase